MMGFTRGRRDMKEKKNSHLPIKANGGNVFMKGYMQMQRGGIELGRRWGWGWGCVGLLLGGLIMKLLRGARPGFEVPRPKFIVWEVGGGGSMGARAGVRGIGIGRGRGDGGDEDAGMDGMSVGLGIGMNINGRGGRMTRSESRRRKSQRGVMSTSGTVIGIGSGSGGEVSPEMIAGLGENAKSRGTAAAGVVGNRDVGIGGKEKGCGSGNGSGMVKKR
jgi:hypothetical protein